MATEIEAALADKRRLIADLEKAAADQQAFIDAEVAKAVAEAQTALAEQQLAIEQVEKAFIAANLRKSIDGLAYIDAPQREEIFKGALAMPSTLRSDLLKALRSMNAQLEVLARWHAATADAAEQHRAATHSELGASRA